MDRKQIKTIKNDGSIVEGAINYENQCIFISIQDYFKTIEVHLTISEIREMLQYKGAVNSMIHLDESDGKTTNAFISYLRLNKIQLKIYSLINSNIDKDIVHEDSICNLKILGCIMPVCSPDHIINILHFNSTHFEYIYSDMQTIDRLLLALPPTINTDTEILHSGVAIPILINAILDIKPFLQQSKCILLLEQLFKLNDDLKLKNDKISFETDLKEEYRVLKESLNQYLNVIAISEMVPNIQLSAWLIENDADFLLDIIKYYYYKYKFNRISHDIPLKIDKDESDYIMKRCNITIMTLDDGIKKYNNDILEINHNILLLKREINSKCKDVKIDGGNKKYIFKIIEYKK